MFLHLGMEKVVNCADIVGIFDLENTTVYKPTRVFLERAEKEGRVVNVCSDIPKTFVVVNQNGVEQVYISGITTTQLYKKATEFPGDIK